MLKSKLQKEKLDKFCNEFIGFFKEEMGEDIGIIKAQAFMEFFLESLGKECYNMGIGAAQDRLTQQMEIVSFELEELKEQ